ncbi:MAG: ABC transporter permease [Candidimonas sp.]|nr:MAG: ABC transporter permease [Candidimonas sp.]
MFTYTCKRLLMTIPVLLFVAVFMFGLVVFTPGDPAAVLAGEGATAQDIAQIHAALGLNQSVVLRFGEWLWAVLHGDLGRSMFTHIPVMQMVIRHATPTVTLMVMTMLVSVLIAVPVGVLAAWYHNRWPDHSVMIFAVFMFSVPAFVVGYLLAWVFGLQLRWFPVQGYVPFSRGVLLSLRSLVLPAITLGSVYVALIARITRATLLDTLREDYIRTARSKGVGGWSLLFHHALKNAANPIVTVIGLGVALLIGGTVVTETVFSIPGLGRMIVDAILQHDYPVIQGTILLFSFAYVLINLAVDLLYRVFDPRIKY